MKKTKQKHIAESAGISEPFLSMIINNDRRPSWPVAKRLAKATKTKPELWLEGTTESIKSALNI
jgi:plasmid maintenance system antidote protein VapI